MHGESVNEVIVVMTRQEAETLLNISSYDESIPAALVSHGEDYDAVHRIIGELNDALREGLED